MAIQKKTKLEGGTLREVMAIEIRRVLATVKDRGYRGMYDAAEVLGITQRTLYKWIGPVESGGWPELQVTAEEAMSKLSTASSSKVKKSPAKKKVAEKAKPAKKPVVKKAIKAEK